MGTTAWRGRIPLCFLAGWHIYHPCFSGITCLFGALFVFYGFERVYSSIYTNLDFQANIIHRLSFVLLSCIKCCTDQFGNYSCATQTQQALCDVIHLYTVKARAIIIAMLTMFGQTFMAAMIQAGFHFFMAALCI